MAALAAPAEGALGRPAQPPTYARHPNPDGDDAAAAADCWSESPGKTFAVRGANYLVDGVKVNSQACAFALLHVEFFALEPGVTVQNMAARPECFAGRLRAQHAAAGTACPFLFVACFSFPGYAFACYFERRRTMDSAAGNAEGGGSSEGDAVDDVADGEGGGDGDNAAHADAFERLWEKFVDGTDEFRNERFKILPGIPPGGGNFVVRRAVGSKPAICSRAVDQVWQRCHKLNYLEADMDVSNSYVATKILAVVKGFAKGLIIDLTFIVEGREVSELPERILCGVRLHKPDLQAMPVWVPGPIEEPDAEGTVAVAAGEQVA